MAKIKSTLLPSTFSHLAEPVVTSSQNSKKFEVCQQKSLNDSVTTSMCCIVLAFFLGCEDQTISIKKSCLCAFNPSFLGLSLQGHSTLFLLLYKERDTFFTSFGVQSTYPQQPGQSYFEVYITGVLVAN